MPIIHTTITKNYIFMIWEIKEELEDLLKILKATAIELEEINKITHLDRKKQNISARIILNHLATKKVQLKYHENGSPYCSEFKNISISHSKNYCTVIQSDNLTGIDIQYRKKNIRNISVKFINSTDTQSWGKDISEHHLHLIWCIKEAIYKTLNKTCSLKENIFVTNPKKANYQNNKVNFFYNIQYEIINNYFLAIAIKI
ncbi:MAG: hypothetical protein CMD26_06215 [Flavobacteriales bacterium]|nr:hypothetical protein [Flavobacteriales bacterium]